jgi:polysaccharide biosynthesis transport protein
MNQVKKIGPTRSNANLAPGTIDLQVSRAENNPVEAELPQSVPSDTITSMIWRRRWTVLLAVALALGAVAAFLHKAVPMYTSTSRIYVEQTGPRIMAETEQGVMTQSINYLFTQAELLKSTDILSVAAKNSGGKYSIGYLRGRLAVTVGEKDDILNVSLDSPQPAKAAEAVNAVVNAYVAYHASRKRNTAADIIAILNDEKRELDKELSQKHQAVMDYEKEHPLLVFETDEGSATLARIEQLSLASTNADLVTMQRKSTYESLKEAVNKPNSMGHYMAMMQRETGGNSATLIERTDLVARLGVLREQRYADRLLGRKALHPNSVILNTEIGETEEKIKQLDKDLIEAQMTIAHQEYLASQAEQQQLHQQLEQQRQQMIELNVQQANFALLQSKYEQAQRRCDGLYERIKEISVTDEAGGLNISILERAVAATVPSTPPKGRYVAISLALGLALGCGLALVQDLKDPRLWSSSEVAATLSAPALGSVPSMPRRHRIERVGHKALLLGLDSPAIEAYRALRTTILYGMPIAEAKTILVSSPQPSEGKTSFVSNLAVSLAQAGQSVIVLDADFRKPRQHKVFGVPNEAGLSEVIAGTADLGQTIQSVQARSTRRLDVLTAGKSLSRSAEAFGSKRFHQIMANLAELPYDHVIIDAPPLIPLADSRVLAAVCDTTILVVRANKTTRTDIQQTRHVLAGIGAHLLGAVINDVPRGRTQYDCCYNNYCYSGGRADAVQQGRKRARVSDTEPPARIVDEIRGSNTRRSMNKRTAHANPKQRRVSPPPQDSSVQQA